MIDPTHELSIARQAELPDLSRSTVYYRPQPVSERDLALMRRIDELHLEHPFAGSRLLRDPLNREGFEVGRKHMATLMRRMGIEALYRQPRTSRRDREDPVYPYLLRGMQIDRPNQVRAMDTTCIPMRRGFVYLTVVLDRTSRRVLAWRLSISLAADAPVEALKEAITRFGKPEILNTDPGSQFTATAVTEVLREHAIRIGMDGKGCWRDNVFVERLGKSVKYEHVYLHGHETVSKAREKLAIYLAFYNRRRPHSSLDRQTPDDVYFRSVPLQMAP